MIERLDEDVVEEMCAHQVITTLPECIKELLENSIDAGAKKITVALDDYGKRQIEVIDNGSGISKDELLKIGIV